MTFVFDSNLEIVKGSDGKSAYELAVENGFNGTIEQWLESLKLGQGVSTASSINLDGYLIGKDTTSAINSSTSLLKAISLLEAGKMVYRVYNTSDVSVSSGLDTPQYRLPGIHVFNSPPENSYGFPADFDFTTTYTNAALLSIPIAAVTSFNNNALSLYQRQAYQMLFKAADSRIWIRYWSGGTEVSKWELLVGKNGSIVNSAYEAAKSGGFNGTESEFNTALAKICNANTAT